MSERERKIFENLPKKEEKCVHELELSYAITGEKKINFAPRMTMHRFI